MEKVIKSLILSALFLTLASAGTVLAEEALPDLSEEAGLADELATLTEPEMPGRLESTGTYFEVKGSEWLNVTLKSSEQIKLTLESVPQMITMYVEQAAGATSAQITIGGLTPDTTYHKYEDNYHNHEAFTTGDDGSYTYAQDLSAPHTVFIQTHKSTKFIKDDGTGGDCYSIGTWDSPTKTCTLTTDLNETIQIDSDGITLDGNGHTLTGNGTGVGVYLSWRTGFTVKNLNINTFVRGVSLEYSSNNTITGINISNNEYGIYLYGNSFSFSNNNTLANNKTSNNSYGIYLISASSNTLTNNITLNNGYGIVLSGTCDSARCYTFSNNVLKGNVMTGNSYSFSIWGWGDVYDNDIDTSNLIDGKPIYYIKNASDQTFDAATNASVFYCINCTNITIDGLMLTNNYEGLVLYNTQNSLIKNVIVSNSVYGITLLSSNNNTLRNNNASNNSYGIYLYSSCTSNNLKDNITSSNSVGMVIGGSSNTIAGNIIESNAVSGIRVYGSNNIISSNTVSSNSHRPYLTTGAGIHIGGSGSSGNIISNNNISNNKRDGMLVLFGRDNVLTNNTCNSNARYGIAISNTYTGITLSGNKLSGNSYNLYFPSRGSELMYYNIDTTNLVEGKPVYYIRDASNQTYDSTTNAGMFACINCNNVTIDGLTLTKNLYGLFLYNSQNSTIHNNTFSGNFYGLYLSGSSNNIIYNNNFLTNSTRAYVRIDTNNIFNLAVPTGGNYWSGWTAPDADGDGFVDSPYAFYGGQDNLPWTKHDGWKPSDSTPPTTTALLSGTLGNNGWYLSDVQVTLTAVDNNGGSGVAKTEYSFDGASWVTYSGPFTVNAEGATTFYYKSTDSAGNAEAVDSLTLSVDKTSPSITGTATTSPNANGWYNSDVMVHFTASDNISGINSVTPDTIISSEGANQSLSGVAFDKAGNSATATVSGINIDKTGPVIIITSPAATQYNHSATINISFTATDNVSGVFKNTVYLDGQQYNPANPISLLNLSLGTHTLEVVSENYAGLIASQSIDFEIIATASGTTSLVTALYQTGAIDSLGIVTSLTQQLQTVQAAINSNQTLAAQNILAAFINMLDAQSGKHISSSAAEILKADALYMISQL